jgi:hypothetical protein
MLIHLFFISSTRFASLFMYTTLFSRFTPNDLLYSCTVHTSRSILTSYLMCCKPYTNLCRVHSLTLTHRRDLLAENQLSDHFLLPSSRAPPKVIGALLCFALIRLDEVAKHLRTISGDDTCVDIGAGTKVVEDTCRYGRRNKIQCLLPLRIHVSDSSTREIR